MRISGDSLLTSNSFMDHGRQLIDNSLECIIMVKYLCSTNHIATDKCMLLFQNTNPFHVKQK